MVNAFYFFMREILRYDFYAKNYNPNNTSEPV